MDDAIRYLVVLLGEDEELYGLAVTVQYHVENVIAYDHLHETENDLVHVMEQEERGTDDEEIAKPDVTVLHPGPMNRGLEISWEVGYCDNAAIRDEVQNGVAVRMALLFLTLTGGKQIENID